MGLPASGFWTSWTKLLIFRQQSGKIKSFAIVLGKRHSSGNDKALAFVKLYQKDLPQAMLRIIRIQRNLQVCGPCDFLDFEVGHPRSQVHPGDIAEEEVDAGFVFVFSGA